MGSGSRRRIRREYRWVLSTPSAWPGMDPTLLGLSDPESTEVGDLLADVVHVARGESYLAYEQYRQLARLHQVQVAPLIPADPSGSAAIAPATRAFEELAAMVAAALGWGDRKAQGILGEAVDLMTRLPAVAQRLRDGVITVEVARKLIERTDLISDGPAGGWMPTESAPGETEPGAIMARVDHAIARELDQGGRGAWTPHLARDMADRIVFREEPDAVRQRRRAAKIDRRAWTSNLDDDMAMLGVTMTAERVQVSIAAIRELAARVCGNDPRTTPQRNSDVMFCLINQVPYRCECGDPATCTSDLPREGADPTAVVPVAARTILHVVADEATVAGHADHPGYLSGHGVISGDHVRDIAADPTTTVRPLAHTYCSLDDVLAWINTTLNNEADTDTDDSTEQTTATGTDAEDRVGDSAEQATGTGDHDADNTAEQTTAATGTGDAEDRTGDHDAEQATGTGDHAATDDHDADNTTEQTTTVGDYAATDDHDADSTAEQTTTTDAHAGQPTAQLRRIHTHGGDTQSADADTDVDDPDHDQDADLDAEPATDPEPESYSPSRQPDTDPQPEPGAEPECPDRRRYTRAQDLFHRLWGRAPGQMLPLSARLFVPATQPANPYKPSTALDTYIRIRDCYSLFPGNPHSAFGCDLDHATEYDHHTPAAGGQTEPANLGAKDRYAHNRKTHGTWTDDLHTTDDGHVIPIYITPERIVIEGRAGPGLDLFPGLARYTFLPTTPTAAAPPPRPRATSSRRQFTLRKHHLRKAERDRNRADRLAHTIQPDPTSIYSRLTPHDDGDPPY